MEHSQESKSPCIVGIIGKKGSGKDTIADYLTNNHNFVKLSFANHLKETCKYLYPLLTDEHLNDPILKERSLSFLPNNRSPRQLMQYLGTDLCRKLDPEIWINRLKFDVEKIPSSSSIVFSDIRHQNELDFVTDFNIFLPVIIINVERPSDKLKNDNHSTENNELDYRFINIVKNDKTKEELYAKIIQLIS